MTKADDFRDLWQSCTNDHIANKLKDYAVDHLKFGSVEYEMVLEASSRIRRSKG